MEYARRLCNVATERLGNRTSFQIGKVPTYVLFLIGLHLLWATQAPCDVPQGTVPRAAQQPLHRRFPVPMTRSSEQHKHVHQDENGWTIIDPHSDTRTIFVSSSQGSDSNDGFSKRTPKKTILAGKALLRNGFPDQLLLKRGDTFTNERLGRIGNSGRSADAPLLIGTYGASRERPRLLTGSQHGIDDVSDIRHVAIIGLYFEPHTRATVQRPANIWRGESSDVLFEDNYFTGYATNLMVQGFDQGGNGRLANIRIRRNIFVDAWSTTSHSQGLFAADIDGLLIEGNVFDHNGWNENVSGGQETIFNHNIYVTGNTRDVTIRGNILSAASSMGIKFQPLHGMHAITDNLFIANAIGLQLGGGKPQRYPPVTGIAVTVTGNVFLGGKNVGSRPHGFGVTLQNLSSGCFSNNIIANNSVNTGNPAISIQDGISGWETQGRGVQNFVIENNTIYNWRGSISILRPVRGDPLPVIRRVMIRSNTIQEVSTCKPLIESYTSDIHAVTFLANTYHSNKNPDEWFRLGNKNMSFTEWVHRTRESRSSVRRVQFVDRHRTLSAYMSTLSMNAPHTRFIRQIRRQSRLSWQPALSAEAIIAFVREGFHPTSGPR